MRYTGGGYYTKILIILIAIWASLQSLQQEKSVFSLRERKLIWFWMGVFFVSLLLAFGRYAPFYRLFYALPFDSTIRNPSKFTHIIDLSLVILFGFGVNGLWRCYLETASSATSSFSAHLKSWWSKVSGFDRKWVTGCGVALAVSLVGWLIYASSRQSLEALIASVGPYPQAASPA